MAEHDRKTRANVNMPPWIVAWLAAVLDKHPGVWRSKADLALDVLKVGMRAFDLGLTVRPAVAPPGAGTAGKDLNVSLPSETVSWFERTLRERPDVARSRRDLVLVVLRVGMRAFEAAGTEARLDVQSEPDEALPVPPELLREIRDFLKTHPRAAKELGYDSPAGFVDYVVRENLLCDADDIGSPWLKKDELAANNEAGILRGVAAAVPGTKGSVVVTPEAVRAVRRFIGDHLAHARDHLGYETPAEFVEVAIRDSIESDAEMEESLAWDAAHPEEARAEEAWDERWRDAVTRRDRAAMEAMSQERLRADAEGRFPWETPSMVNRRRRGD